MTTQMHLWLVIDNRPRPDRMPREIVACTIDEHPYEVARIPIAYADTYYIDTYGGGAIWPRTSADNRISAELDEIFAEQELQRRRIKGGPE